MGPSDLNDLLDAIRWCTDHEATVRWGRSDDGLPVCRVEALAPSSTWNILRGEGQDLVQAYFAVRIRFEAEQHRLASREGYATERVARPTRSLAG